MTAHAGPVMCVGYDRTGSFIVSGSWDRTVRIWDVSTGRELRRFIGHTGLVNSVAWSPDARQVVSASRDGTIRVWDVGATSVPVVPRGHRGNVLGVAFSSDGEQIATGSTDGTVRVWKTRTIEEMACLTGHQAWVWCVSFSPDGRLLASGSEDGTVRIWDLERAIQLRCLQHGAGIYGVAFCSDGHRVASFFGLNSARVLQSGKPYRVWDVATGRCLQELGPDANPMPAKGRSDWTTANVELATTFCRGAAGLPVGWYPGQFTPGDLAIHPTADVWAGGGPAFHVLRFERG